MITRAKTQNFTDPSLGLFAVFGILRYRTEAIRMRDLTYLFIVIGLGILNAVANKKISLVELLTVDVMIVGLTAAVELSPKHRVLGETPILYDNLALLGPGREVELHADLTKRTPHRSGEPSPHRSAPGRRRDHRVSRCCVVRVLE